MHQYGRHLYHASLQAASSHAVRALYRMTFLRLCQHALGSEVDVRLLYYNPFLRAPRSLGG